MQTERISVPGSTETKILSFEIPDNHEFVESVLLVADYFDLESAEVAFNFIAKDKERLLKTIRSIKTDGEKQVLAEITNHSNVEIASEMLTYDHKALLLIADQRMLSGWLKESGFNSGTSIGSVNVVKRLQKRYNTESPVAIWRTGLLVNGKKRQIEIFLPNPKPHTWSKEIIEKEQDGENETHTAFTIKPEANYEEAVAKLLNLGLTLDGEMTINNTENSSTQYFINNQNHKRLELIRYNIN